VKKRLDTKVAFSIISNLVLSPILKKQKKKHFFKKRRNYARVYPKVCACAPKDLSLKITSSRHPVGANAISGVLSGWGKGGKMNLFTGRGNHHPSSLLALLTSVSDGGAQRVMLLIC